MSSPIPNQPTELLPCPLPMCRSAAVSLIEPHYGQNGYKAHCRNCALDSAVFKTRSALLAFWNTRPADPRIAELEMDKTRLDWLQENHHSFDGSACFLHNDDWSVKSWSLFGADWQPTLRQAIDAAIAKGQV